MKTWNADELRSFLEQVGDDRFYPVWMLLSTTGMRRGEALGLHWRDVSLDHAWVSVHQALVLVGNEPALQETKTAKGRRSIALSPETVAALRAHRKRQLAEKMSLGPDYAESDLVFRREDGTLVHPSTLSRRFGKLVRQTDLPEIRLHDLRHTFATAMLQAGVNVKVVSEMLGHASRVDHPRAPTNTSYPAWPRTQATSSPHSCSAARRSPRSSAPKYA